MPTPSPLEILQHLLETRGLIQEDLVSIIGSRAYAPRPISWSGVD
jgi:antitoxin component HigA of HigAB toxin-antitoxin module